MLTVFVNQPYYNSVQSTPPIQILVWSDPTLNLRTIRFGPVSLKKKIVFMKFL